MRAQFPLLAPIHWFANTVCVQQRPLRNYRIHITQERDVTMYSPNELRKRTTAALLLANCLFGLPVGLTAAVSPAAAEDATASSGAAGAIRGLIKATQEVTISGGMVSRITVAPFKEGDTFVKGDRLIAFDCTQLHAERDGARAALRGLRVTYQSNVKLKRYGAGGSYAVNTALADVDKAIANIKVLVSTAAENPAIRRRKSWQFFQF